MWLGGYDLNMSRRRQFSGKNAILLIGGSHFAKLTMSVWTVADSRNVRFHS